MKSTLNYILTPVHEYQIVDKVQQAWQLALPRRKKNVEIEFQGIPA